MSDGSTAGSTGRGEAACRTGHAACSLPHLGIPTTTPRGEHSMSNTDSSTEARSSKERALSRAADALAGYMSDSRGWASPITGPEVMQADDRGDERDALKDLVADLTHLAEHMATRTVLSTPSSDGQRDPAYARKRAERTVRAGITTSYAEWEGDAFSPPLSDVPFDVIEYVQGSEVQS